MPTETIPLLDTFSSRSNESKLGTTSNKFPCDKDLNEREKKCESTSCIPSSIMLRRHSSSSSYSTAINLSIDSKRVRLSSSPTWEKPLRGKHQFIFFNICLYIINMHSKINNLKEHDQNTNGIIFAVQFKT